MLPPGHLAISYLAARPILRRSLDALELAALSAGTLLPAAANVFLDRVGNFGLNDKWTHSPLTLAALALFCGVAYQLSLPRRNLLLLLLVGMACHLAADYLFDWVLLYFNGATDEIGGWWLYPFTRITISGPRLEPGFNIWGPELLAESVLLAGAVWGWRRLDLAAYAALTLIVTLLYFRYIPGVG